MGANSQRNCGAEKRLDIKPLAIQTSRAVFADSARLSCSPGCRECRDLRIHQLLSQNQENSEFCECVEVRSMIG
jgi:hypothetical protein